MASNDPGDDIVATPRDPDVADFAGLWSQSSRDGRLPARADFPIEALRRWMGRVLIMDVIDGGADFRYRLIGTIIVSMVGRDLTGRRVSECDYDGGKEGVVRSFLLPVQTRAPVFRRGNLYWRAGMRWRRYESVHCPLAADGETIDMTIGVQKYWAP